MNKQTLPLKKVASYSDTRISAGEISKHNYVGTDNINQNKTGRVDAIYTPVEGNVTEYINGDILVGNIRPYLKKIWYADTRGGGSADVLTIRTTNTRFDSKFVYYSLLRDDFFDYMMQGSKGSKMPRGDKKQVMEFPVPNFAFDCQKSIAAVLSALDDKIELNRKINAELEQMARTLYDYWFVQFDFPDANGKHYKSSDGQMVYNEKLKREIPKGWETLKLQDALEFEKGTEPGTDAYSEIQNNEYDLPFYRVGDIDGQTGTYIDSSKTKTKTVKPTDVIVTFDGSVGKMGLGLDGAISGGLRHIYDKAGKISDAGIYAIFSDEYITKTIERYATGSVILHASSSIPYLVIPYDEKVFAEFQKIIEPMFAKIIANRQQSQKLAELRDWLLPMLMNGQVRA